MSALQPTAEFHRSFEGPDMKMPPTDQIATNACVWGLFGAIMETMCPVQTKGLFVAAAIGVGAGEELLESYLENKLPKKIRFLNPILSTVAMTTALVGGACLSETISAPVRTAITAGYLFAITASVPKSVISSPCYTKIREKVLTWLRARPGLL